MENIAACHTVAFCAIKQTAKKITAGHKNTARGKSVWRKNESELSHVRTSEISESLNQPDFLGVLFSLVPRFAPAKPHPFVDALTVNSQLLERVK